MVDKPVAPEFTHSLENELEEIRGLLAARGLDWRFSADLESGFYNYVRERSLDILSHRWAVLIALYFLIGLSTYLQVRQLSYPLFLQGNLDVWWAVYLLEGVVIAGLVLSPHIGIMRKHYGYSMGVIAFVALSSITIATSAFPDPYFNQHSSYVVILITSIVYGIGGLSLKQATIASWLAGVVAWLAIWYFNLWLDWGMYLQYVGLANIVGMMLCYVLEMRDRKTYLQARLLSLEKEKLDVLSQEMARMSREDVLTGLANRRHFNEVFQSEWDRARREQQPLSLIFADIDYFKPFNDTHGHLEGDRVLAEVGKALKSVVRRGGDMAARYGGEEFVILLPGTPIEGAIGVANQIMDVIHGLSIPHRASGVSSCITISAGIASIIPSSGVRSAQLIDWADEAVYAAKKAGRDRIHIWEKATIVPLA